MFLKIIISPITLEVINNLFDVIIKLLAIIIVTYVIVIYREVRKLYQELIKLEESKQSQNISEKINYNISLRNLHGFSFKSESERDEEIKSERETITKDIDSEIRSIKLRIESKLFLLKIYR